MMTAPSSDDFLRTLKCAKWFRGLGWQPLPSRMDRKGPALSTFADHWNQPLPDQTYSEAEWKTTNIQLMCGVHWGLCVVDCDGVDAHNAFHLMADHHGGCPPTWVVETGGGGWHYYFTLPPWLDECPSKRLWGVWDTWAGTNLSKPGSPPKGDWQKHREVRLLGDRALAIAPPSIHVTTGNPYQWLRRPTKDDRPALAPSWLLMLPEAEPPASPEKLPPISIASKAPGRPAGASFQRDEVRDAIPSKIDVARRWGLRTAGTQAGPKGWWNCWAIDRDEKTPSSQFSESSGVYWCGREKTSIGLFDLAVALNAYTTWQEACNALGAEFLVNQQASPTRPPRVCPPARPHTPTHTKTNPQD